MKKIMKPIRNIEKKIFYSLPSSRILMFHHVTDKPAVRRSGCVLSSDLFYKIVNAKEEKIVTLSEILRSRVGNGNIALTFDDGLADLYTIAYPYLKAHNCPFTIFIVSDFLDKPGYITKEQFRELAADPLVTIGSHGTSHKLLTELEKDEIEEELNDSQNLLEALSGKKVDMFAYSHGQYNKYIIKKMKKMKKYVYAMTTAGQPYNVLTSLNRMTVPRINVDSYTIQRMM